MRMGSARMSRMSSTEKSGKNPHSSRPDYERLRESITSIDDISAMHPELLCHRRLSTSFFTVSTVEVDRVGYVRLSPQANSLESWLIRNRAHAAS